MAWDLWGPQIDAPAEETSSYTQPERQCDFYSGPSFDVIEEEALNEKWVVQVLKILITKADDEINELELDLVSLQSELAWIENEEWHEICCNALKEKINYLDMSINNLRNKDKNDDVEVHLLMHTQPAETLHQILKGLLTNYVRNKDAQPEGVKDAIVVDSGLDTLRHGTDVRDESRFKSEGIMNNKGKASSATSTEHSAILNSSLKLQEKKTNNLKTVKPANTNVKDSRPHSLTVKPGHSDEKKLSSKFGPKGTGYGEARECGSTPKDKRLADSSSKPACNGSHCVEMVKVELANIGVSDSITDASKHAAEHSYKRQKLSDSDPMILHEVEEQSSTSPTDVILALKRVVKKTDLAKKVKPANTVAKDLGLNANKNAAGHSNKMEKLCKPGLKVTGNQEVRDHCSRAMEKISISRSSLNPEGKRHHPRTDKPADAIVKNVSAEALRSATRFNMRIENSGSRLGNSKQAKSNNSDIEQKLCDIAAMHKRTTKESNFAPTDHVVSLNSYVKTKQKKKTLQIVRIREAGLIDTQKCALTSVLELLDQKGQTAAQLQPQEEGKPVPGVQMADDAADEKPCNLDLSVNPQNEKAKRSNKSNPLILQEISFSQMVVVPSSSSIPEGKKQRKSGAGPPNAVLNKSLNGKITKKVVEPAACNAREDGTVPDDCPNSVSQRHMKRKRCSNFPITTGIKDSNVQMDFSNSCTDSTISAIEDDLLVPESSSICDSSSDGVASLPSAIINLNDLKLVHLRAIAKHHKLTGYAKLRKSVLLELIANRISNC